MEVNMTTINNTNLSAIRTLSFDAETNGLWGQAFAIAAVIYEDGKEVSTFLGRCPIEEDVNGWVAENVLPQMEGIPETYGSYSEMLKAFADYYQKEKKGANIIVHMGVPVESQLFRDMHTAGFIGDWDAPYPLIDIAGNLQQAGFDPTSVDTYNKDHGLEVPACEGGTHNPLFDSRAAALCYLHLMAGK